MYEYKAKAIRVVDGDTVYFEVDVGFKTKMTHSFRLLDIDTPELRKDNPEGHIAKVAMGAKLGMHLPPEERPRLMVRTKKDPDSFGRYFATVAICDANGDPFENVNEWMLEQGYAVPYVKRSKRK